MPNKGKMAWLITWEDLGNADWQIDKPRLVAILSPRFKSRTVEQFLVALWCAEAPLTLSERMAYSLLTRRQRPKLIHAGDDHFYFGLKPFLYARRVTHLRCDEKGQVHTLHWTETPVYRLDDEQNPGEPPKFKVIRPARENSFSQRVKDAIGIT